MTRLVVLDFDGTLTDAELEGRPFWDGYLEDLATLTGHPLSETQAQARRFEAELLEHPQDHGWRWGGRIVCPATVDPYQRMMAVANRILEGCGSFSLEVERDRLQQILFRYNYSKTVCVLRPFAREVLAALSTLDTWIVTNAHVDPVRAKIDTLGELFAWLGERVLGRAAKHVVDDLAETDLPRELLLPGLARPVLLRRPFYRKALERLKGERGWDEVTVVGDIFELDLSLPLALGARVVLAANAFTPPWERDYVRGHPRGHVLEDLRELTAILERA